MTISGRSHSPEPMPSAFLVHDPRSAPRLLRIWPGWGDGIVVERLGALAVIKGWRKEWSGTKLLRSYRNEPHG